MIKIGDIVVRKSKSGLRLKGDPMSANWLFYSGYFIVLSVTRSETDPMYCVCLIMNSSGEKSWIDKRSIKCVVELQSEK